MTELTKNPANTRQLKSWPTKAEQGEVIPDEELAKVAQKIEANEEMMSRCFMACVNSFKEVYGSEPDQTGDVWKWYLSAVFPLNHRLALQEGAPTNGIRK